MQQAERNLSEEIDYLSGAIFAHEILLIHLAKVLVVAEITDENSLQQLLTQLSNARLAHSDVPMFDTGYREALRKISDSLLDIH